ncbi:MAG: hypothetical protein P8N23_07995 [Methylophilaceae bacterium]|nr:hypothetical protein [Methylophilaceae bacterium]
MFFRMTAIISLLLFGLHNANALTKNDNQTLLLQKQYLNQINACAAPSTFSRLIEEILNSQSYDSTANFAMNIEEMILQNPACFVEASIKIGSAKCKILESKFINEPYFNPRENLKQALSSTNLYSKSCFAH